jgi:myo-inositol 2-dehydrogenase/D-chiro-inositol 1-dehydrogenase
VNKVRVGIAGLGRLGKSHAANLAFKVKNAELVAACSVVPEEHSWARENLALEAMFDDLEDMLRQAELDAVFLVTPTTLHPQQIVDSLQAGVHVFCEKPLALTMEDCERVMAVRAQHPEQVATIGFVRRYDPEYAYAKRKIEEGAIGRPILFRGQTADMDNTAAFQVQFSRTSGGVFLDASIHDMDLARWLLDGEVQEVYCVGDCYVHEGFREFQDADNATALYRFDNGAAASITVSRTTMHGHDTFAEITGTRGSLLIGRPNRVAQVDIFDEHGMRIECVPTFFERFEKAFLLEAEDFVNCALHGGSPRCDLSDAVQATRVAIATTEAYRSGEVVKL